MKSLTDTYLELDFDVRDHATGNIYTNSEELSSLNLAGIALFSEYKLTNSSGKKTRNFYYCSYYFFIV